MKTRNPFGITMLIVFILMFVTITSASAAGNQVRSNVIPPIQNTNVKYINGIQAAKTPVANQLLALNASKKFPASVLPIYNSSWTGSTGLTGFKIMDNFNGGMTTGIWGQVSSSVAGSVGVFGYAAANSGKVYGVYGDSSSPSGAGVLASGSGASGTALQIANGGIKVTGAGTNTNTAAFIQLSALGNIDPYYADATMIDNSLTNGNPNAILIVTPNYNPTAGYSALNNHPVGVTYVPANAKWEIFNLDGTAMPTGTAFNVLIILP